MLQLLALMIVIMATFSLKSALTIAVSCHTSSKECRYVGYTSISSTSNREYDKRFWKSRQLISMRVGTTSKLETRTYVVRLFGELIPNNLVNLLLTF